jgi:hypothetical protein
MPWRVKRGVKVQLNELSFEERLQLLLPANTCSQYSNFRLIQHLMKIIEFINDLSTLHTTFVLLFRRNFSGFFLN